MNNFGTLLIQVIIFMHGRPQKITLVREKYISHDMAVEMWNDFRKANSPNENMIANWIPDSISLE